MKAVASNSASDPLRSISCLLLMLGIASAAEHRWSLHQMSEQWTGLRGTVLRNGEQTEVFELLWKITTVESKDGKVLIPRPIILVGTKPQFENAADKYDVLEPVVIRVGGQSVEFARWPRDVATKPSQYDYEFLAYPLEADSTQLRLQKAAGRGTEWRVVDAEHRFTRNKGEYQFTVEQKSKFRLEAKARPGWFLTRNGQGRLCLSDDRETKHFVEMEVETHFDDLSDGK